MPGGGLGTVKTDIARTFAALNATNEAILYAKSPEELYEKVCEAAFSSGGFLAAAIFLLDPATNFLRFAAGCGAATRRFPSRAEPSSVRGPQRPALAAGRFPVGNRHTRPFGAQWPPQREATLGRELPDRASNVSRESEPRGKQARFPTSFEPQAPTLFELTASRIRLLKFPG